MADETWFSIEVPVLEYIANNGGWQSSVSVVDISDATGIPVDEVAGSLMKLDQAGFLGGEFVRMMSPPQNWFVIPGLLSERGLRTVGAWPSEDPYETLLEIIDRQAQAAEADDDRRSRLLRFKDAVVGIGRDVAVGVLVEMARRGVS